MNSLVDIVVFGIVGAAMMAALLGLALVVAGRAPGRAFRIGFGAVTVALLIAVPALAAVNTFGSGGGFLEALFTAFAVAVIVYAVNVALLPAVMRRAGATAPGAARLSPAVLVGGLVVCAVLALAGTGIGAVAA